jgi:nucleoside transporter
MFELCLAQAVDVTASESPGFFAFVGQHWQFCLLHFLNFAIWGSWIVVLGNMLDARGFSRLAIGRIYGTMPIGAMITPLFVGPIADNGVPVEYLLAGCHLVGGVLLFVMSQMRKAVPFFICTLLYALAYSPTLGLVNSMVFANNEAIFDGFASDIFPWVRVFGTLGWITAGLSLIFILKKGQPVNERPLILAGALSLILGAYCFTLPHTVSPPTEFVLSSVTNMVTANPIFYAVTFVGSIAMGLYFAFGALFVEKTGVAAKVVGPVMTIGQWIEIFFLLTLPIFLGGPGQPNMNLVLLIGISAWAIRFMIFAIGKPLALVLGGVAIHGICFDFFFGAGFINAENNAPEGLTNTAQQLYGFLVYGLGMFLGSEGGGWLNKKLSREIKPATETEPAVLETNWRAFWGIPAAIVAVSAILFAVGAFALPKGDEPTTDPLDPAASLTRNLAEESLELPLGSTHPF